MFNSVLIFGHWLRESIFNMTSSLFAHKAPIVQIWLIQYSLVNKYTINRRNVNSGTEHT